MAKIIMLCSSFCLYLYIILTISWVAALNDHYFYETQTETHHKNQDFSIELHHLHRRDVDAKDKPPLSTTVNQASIRNDTNKDSNKTTKFNNNAATSKVNLTRSNTQVPLIFPADATKADAKLSTPPVVPYILPQNVTLVATEKNIELLGVNGTGQRKYFPSTTPPSSTYPTLLHDIPRNKSGKPNLDEVVDNISISKFSDKELNKTLAEHNITSETVVENLKNNYYNSSFINDPDVTKHYWVNLNEMDNVTTHDLLSSAHRRAATVTLSFWFPFYGHYIKNVTMATGGFIYTGDYVHAWLAATQYIAPLMANFDTSLSNDSYVRYVDNGTAFTVLWERVSLKDESKTGEFTFQTTLHKNGDIIFVYQSVPTPILNITDDQHPVKVGLSDAYIIDSTLFFLRRKTIYEYDRVNFQKFDIRNGTVIILKALPTCLNQASCESCLTKKTSSFQCVWCPALKKCSSGVDRHRQEWILRGCDQMTIKNESSCSKADSYSPAEHGRTAYVHDSGDMDILVDPSKPSTGSFKQPNVITAEKSSSMGTSGILSLIILISMITGMTIWVFYAYRNPHTTSGQMLIRYRPTQWRWKRGEARYTAATIHM